MISIPIWAIPTAITVVAFLWALFIVDGGGGGYFSGLSNLFALIPASMISMVSWIVYAIFK